MQVDYFDIKTTPEAQPMVLPWPLKFVGFNLRGDAMRIYYAVMPQATEQQGTFYCVKSEQELPETFPAQLIATLYAKDDDSDDNAVHLFFEIPVNKPKKPRPAKRTGGQKISGAGKGDNGNGAAD